MRWASWAAASLSPSEPMHSPSTASTACLPTTSGIESKCGPRGDGGLLRTRTSERWGIVVVGVGWGWSEPGGFAGLAAGLSRLPILSAFGGDAVCSVLGAGAAAFGHHRGPVAAVVGRRVCLRRGYFAGGPA